MSEAVLSTRQRVLARWPIIAFTIVWALLAAAPLLLTLVYSFLKSSGVGISWHLSTDGWKGLTEFGRSQALLRTVRIVLIATAIELVLAFPAAYWLAKRVRRRSVTVIILVLLTVPFFLSEDSRTVVWQSVYNRGGLVNTVLVDIGVIDHPISSLLFSEFSLYLGLIPIYFATMVFPLWMAMNAIDDEYLEGARDLGASYFDLLKDIVIPLAAPGIIGGIIFTLVPMLGDTVVPSLLGGGQIVLISDTIQSLVTVFEYPPAAAISIAITLIVILLLFALSRTRQLRGALWELQR